MRVLVKTPISSYSGYGRDGIGIIRALIRLGADVYLHPTHVDPPLPSDITDLFQKELKKPFDLVINHEDPGQLEVSSNLREDSLVVGWTMWEYSTLDNLKKSKLKTIKKRMKGYDALLSYDSVTQGALSPYLQEGTSKIILQGGYDPEHWQPVKRDWFSDRLGFMMCGQLHERKDPFVAIQAFKSLKEKYPIEFGGAELHLKTNIRTLHPEMENWCPKLKIHYATWSTEILTAFYHSQHVLLAPSRGEGKNLPALEFQTTGGAVIATNWGGHTSWMQEDWAYPLDYVLRPESDKFPDCKSARASKEHLEELMMHTYKNREELRDKAKLASTVIPQMCSWDVVINNLFLKLRDSVPEKGEDLYNKMIMARRYHAPQGAY